MAWSTTEDTASIPAVTGWWVTVPTETLQSQTGWWAAVSQLVVPASTATSGMYPPAVVGKARTAVPAMACTGSVAEPAPRVSITAPAMTATTVAVTPAVGGGVRIVAPRMQSAAAMPPANWTVHIVDTGFPYTFNFPLPGDLTSGLPLTFDFLLT